MWVFWCCVLSVAMLGVMTGCSHSTNRSLPGRTSLVSAHEQIEVVNLGMSSSQGSTNQGFVRKPDSQKLAHQVLSHIVQNDDFSQLHLQVASYHGAVMVIGEVGSEANRQRIDEIVRAMPEVSTVYVQLQPHENISVQQQVKDSLCLRHAKDVISRLDPPQSHLALLCNQQTVYVLGTVSEGAVEEIRRALQSRDYAAIFFHS